MWVRSTCTSYYKNSEHQRLIKAVPTEVYMSNEQAIIDYEFVKWFCVTFK